MLFPVKFLLTLWRYLLRHWALIDKCLLVTGLIALFGMGGAKAQDCTSTMSQAFSVADGAGGCLAVLPVISGGPTSRELVVMLHGDGRGTLTQPQVEQWINIGKRLQAPGRNVVFLIRPGYQTPLANSSGWANPRDDDYTTENLNRIEVVIKHLREKYQAQHVMLLGHSGGSALSALLIGKASGPADAALLLGCPCDLIPWRRHRTEQNGNSPWVHSLDPLTAAPFVPAETPVLLVTGSQDDNTLAVFAQHWVASVPQPSRNVQFEMAEGLTHSSVRQWPELSNKVDDLFNRLNTRVNTIPPASATVPLLN